MRSEIQKRVQKLCSKMSQATSVDAILAPNLNVNNFNVFNSDENSVREEFYRNLEASFFNLTLFGANSIEHLFEREKSKRFLVDRPNLVSRSGRRRRDQKGELSL